MEEVMKKQFLVAGLILSVSGLCSRDGYVSGVTASGSQGHSSITTTGSQSGSQGGVVRQPYLSYQYNKARSVTGHPGCKVYKTMAQACQSNFVPKYKTTTINGKQAQYAFTACGDIYFCDTLEQLKKVLPGGTSQLAGEGSPVQTVHPLNVKSPKKALNNNGVCPSGYEFCTPGGPVSLGGPIGKCYKTGSNELRDCRASRTAL
jgi:hypothetical protein